MQRQPSRTSTKSSDSSSVQGTSSPLVDSLLKSLAKDQQPLEARNQTTVGSSEKESEPMKTSLTVETIANQVQLVPNNQVGGTSSLPPRTPIPPESLKCNILKATLEQGKNSNLVSITSTDSAGAIAKKNQHSDAATIVSVVSIVKLVCSFLYFSIVFCPAYISFKLSFVYIDRVFSLYSLKFKVFLPQHNLIHFLYSYYVLLNIIKFLQTAY